MKIFETLTDEQLEAARVEAAQDIASANKVIDFFRDSMVDMPGGMERFDITVRVMSMARIIETEFDPQDVPIILATAIERLVASDRRHE